MPHKETYNDILLQSDDYLAEIALKLKNKNLVTDALKQAQDAMLSVVEDQKNAVLNKRKYERLLGLLEILEDDLKRELLQKFLTQIYQMANGSYDPELHFENIRSYERIGVLFDQDLISALVVRFQRHIKKEVKYLQMTDTDFVSNEVCDLAIGSIHNLTTTYGEPSEQQKYEIALLYEIFNFRLSTLNEEQVWDFMAQTIMEETRMTRP